MERKPNPQEISSGDKKIECKYTIYVLKLEKGRYYVGRCQNYRLAARIKEHRLKKDGSAWTSLYSVVEECQKLYEYGKSPFDEDRKVKELMYIYGPDKVRGGTYSQIALSPQITNSILNQFKGATDLCFKCGEYGHFVKKCPKLNKKEQIQKIEKKIKEELKKMETTGTNTEEIQKKAERKIETMKQYWYLPTCKTCGGYGHYQCDYNTFEPAYRNQYVSFIKCWNCGQVGHKAQDCWQSDYDSSESSEEEISDDHSDDDDGDDDDDDGDDDDDDDDDDDENSYEKYKRSRSRNKTTNQRDDCYNCGEFGHFARQCPKKRYYRR